MINKPAKSNDELTWSWFPDVQDWKVKGFSGIGFVLSKEDPFTIIDLDKCLIEGKITDFAKNVVNYFDSYTEISPSGQGLHIIIFGKTDKAVKRKEIEIYYDKRYMCMTGEVYLKKPVEDRQKQLNATVKKYSKVEKVISPSIKSINGNGKFRMPSEIISEGERNNELAKWAGVLNNKDIGESEYYTYLYAINNNCCVPPVTVMEVQSVGKSIWRYK